MFFLVNISLKFIAPRVCPGNTEKFCTSLARLLKGAWHDSKKQTCWYVLRDVLNVDRMKLAWHQGPGLYCSLNPLHRAQCLEHSRFIHSSTNSSLMNELMTHAQEDKGRSIFKYSQLTCTAIWKPHLEGDKYTACRLGVSRKEMASQEQLLAQTHFWWNRNLDVTRFGMETVCIGFLY